MAEQGKAPVREREYGIDLLKMLSMQMIVFLHVLGVGGVLENLPVLSGRYGLFWLVEGACYCAVNCFALATGYLMCRGRFRYHRLFSLWLQVIFYTVGVTVFFSLWQPELVTPIYWKAAFRPVVSKTYWYFTAYFAMYFFIPFFNRLLEVLNRKELQRLLLTGALLICLAYVVRDDLFRLHGGYTAVWLAYLYFAGAYFKKYPFEKPTPIRWLALYLLMVLVSWGGKMAGLLLQSRSEIFAVLGNNLYSYVSPTMLIASVALFLAMTGLKIRSPLVQKLVSICAPAAFSVYLIHCHPLIWHNVLTGRFASAAFLPPVQAVALVLAGGLAIYWGGTLVDLVRIRIFKWLRIDKRIARVAGWCADRCRQDEKE